MAKQKMRVPDVYQAEKLKEDMNTISTEVKGRWIPVRPMGWTGYALRRRLKAAWMVFTGNADAVRWSANG